MAARRVQGTALLVAGYGSGGGTALDASAVHTLGQIGEALLSTGDAWQIRRLTVAAGERYTADRATLKRHLDELIAEPARVAMLVVIGTIVDLDGEPALVTGPQARAYPEDATLPLAWIRERLLAARAEQLVVVLSALGAGSQRRWLEVLSTRKQHHLIAIEAIAAPEAGEAGASIADALLAGLCGEAVDPRTGTITMASLGDHLTTCVPVSAVQACEASETIAQPPPLAGLWDVRRSQLSARGTRPRVARGPSLVDDLTGAVLPGRFRVDSRVARGTFGTVYRARQLAVERDVALKVLHADIDPSSEDGRLFVHEIRSVGRIDHANVVRIHQADITHDGRLFFAMELLEGRDLHELAKDGPIPRARAVELVCQLLAGLGAAHDAGLVHADIKPANALVTERDGSERVVLVDFGLSRLRAPDRPAESAGGTPAYMAPEQMMEGRVDARSDLFSAALVLVHLVTGWRRPNAFTLTPPFELIEDPELRGVLERALAIDPAERYPSARELAAALTGSSAPASAVTAPAPVLPFRHLSPLTEADRGRLFGRERDLAVITEHAIYRRSVIYTAPSGVGKTSMLRAGLLPRLEALGVRAIYHRVRGDGTAALANAIYPQAASIQDAIASWHVGGGGKLVLVLDQLESALAETDASRLVREVLAFDTWPAEADVAVVLTIREDYLARLVARTQELEPGLPIVRLPPLGTDGARDAIVGPLTESRLAIEPEMLDSLLADLQRAAAALAPEMGWSGVPAVYPPHLQLACSVLYDALGPGDVAFTLAHYRRLGGFDAIVGEHLERVLETELSDGRDRIARALFLALVTTAHERAMRGEAELLEIVGVHHAAHEIQAVLEALRSRGLLVRIRDSGGEPGWELVHDSLVPRVLAWIDRRDLDRRRAIEVLRYHLRRSRPEAPSLLGRAELRELAPHADAIVELDAEWQKRELADGAWTPSRLVERAKQTHRRRTAMISSLLLASLAIASIGMYRSHVEHERTAIETSLRTRDLGRFTLALEPFDWDPAARRALPIEAHVLPELSWRLHAPHPDDPAEVGPELTGDLLVRGTPRFESGVRLEQVEAHGGPAFLVISRGACPPSIVPVASLPGYTVRDRPELVIRVRVPTCQAMMVDTIELPAGTFIYGGVGDPPSEDARSAAQTSREQRLAWPASRIDRTEVTNAAYAVFSTMERVTGIGHPQYPPLPEYSTTAGAAMPVSGIDWYQARAYCRFMGKELPSSRQWSRALRGRELLADGSRNPEPRRNLPWGRASAVAPARLLGIGDAGPAEVGSFVLDRSPDGVMDLAGNVSEWLADPFDRENRVRAIRGGNLYDSDLSILREFMAVDNVRAPGVRYFGIGVRCASR